MGFIIIKITCPTIEEARRISTHLLQKKLISSANFFPVKSFFWWKDKIDNSNEIVTIAKTRKENWEKVKSEVKKMHSYETPCILKIDVEANEDFGSWVKSETK
jgi:periplasmic divalent cation tolerance protein